MKKIKLFFIASFTIAIMTTSGCAQNHDFKNQSTVKTLNIERYMGTWYEIARFPHSFEKNLVGVTANYTLLPNGKIKVINQGYFHTFDGKLKQAKGKAKLPKTHEPGKLKVSFFLFFYADYYILQLDEINYQYALIGSSSPNYLWILSRKPQLEDSIYLQLVENAKQRGYNIEKLYKVPQK